jgi:hypothetical protein
VKKLLVIALILTTAMLGVPGTVAAQTRGTTIEGQSVDAAGRPVINQRVDLVRDGAVLQSTTTGVRGEFSFANVAAGEYIVRMTVNGQTAGLRLPVAAGQTVASATIVASSAAAPSAAFLVLGLIPLLTTAAVATAVVTTAVVVTGS